MCIKYATPQVPVTPSGPYTTVTFQGSCDTATDALYLKIDLAKAGVTSAQVVYTVSTVTLQFATSEIHLALPVLALWFDPKNF